MPLPDPVAAHPGLVEADGLLRVLGVVFDRPLGARDLIALAALALLHICGTRVLLACYPRAARAEQPRRGVLSCSVTA